MLGRTSAALPPVIWSFAGAELGLGCRVQGLSISCMGPTGFGDDVRVS